MNTVTIIRGTMRVAFEGAVANATGNLANRVRKHLKTRAGTRGVRRMWSVKRVRNGK